MSCRARSRSPWRSPPPASCSRSSPWCANWLERDVRKLLTDSGLVFGRSLRAARRQAAVVLVAPTLLATAIVLLFDGLYGTIAQVEAYPGGFIDWVAPAAVILTVFLAAGLTAASLISDLRSGYLDRLRLLSIAPASMILGRAGFDALRALPPAAA